MIEDLRFVKRYVSLPEGAGEIIRVLQAYDGNVWFDIPLERVEDDNRYYRDNPFSEVRVINGGEE